MNQRPSKLKALLITCASTVLGSLCLWGIEHAITSIQAHEDSQDARISTNAANVQVNGARIDGEAIKQDDAREEVHYIRDRVDRIYDILSKDNSK